MALYSAGIGHKIATSIGIEFENFNICFFYNFSKLNGYNIAIVHALFILLPQRIPNAAGRQVKTAGQLLNRLRFFIGVFGVQVFEQFRDGVLPYGAVVDQLLVDQIGGEVIQLFRQTVRGAILPEIVG